MRQHEITTPRRASRGFSLAETLVALLIVTMLTALVANGIPIAKRTFESVRDKSNAQVALSTTTAALRNELGLALDAQQDGGVWYYQDASGAWVHIEAADDGSTLLKKYYQIISEDFHELPGSDGKQIIEPLIPEESFPDGLSVALQGISYDRDKGRWSVEGLCIRGAGGHDLAWIGDENDHTVRENYLVRAVL